LKSEWKKNLGESSPTAAAAAAAVVVVVVAAAAAAVMEGVRHYSQLYFERLVLSEKRKRERKKKRKREKGAHLSFSVPKIEAR